MLYLYFGTDTIAVRKLALGAFARFGEDGLRLEQPEPSVWSEGLLAEIAGSTSLFGEATAFLIDTPSEDEEFNTKLLSALPDLMSSSNTIIVIEKSVLAAPKKKWQAAGALMEEVTAGPAVRNFDVFTLAEALSNKDKKSLWILLMQAKQAGLAAEEIIGTLWWQLKTLRLALCTSSATEAGMKDYPYSKAKRALKNFKEGEVDALSKSLLKVYHDGHGGVKDIEVGLEEWVLTM
jgi:DNA polymerase III delta subunit